MAQSQFSLGWAADKNPAIKFQDVKTNDGQNAG
jgi:hypothetical protein